MAELTKGGLKGEKCKILQFCNDWFCIEVRGRTRIVGPTSIKLSPAEAKKVTASHKAGNAGTLLSEFQLKQDGTFERRV